jgi:hypothetical protein
MFVMLAPIHSPTLGGAFNADSVCCCWKGCACWGGCGGGGGDPVEETFGVPGLTLVALGGVQRADVFLNIRPLPTNASTQWIWGGYKNTTILYILFLKKCPTKSLSVWLLMKRIYGVLQKSKYNFFMRWNEFFCANFRGEKAELCSNLRAVPF